MESPPGYPRVNLAMEGSRHSGALSTGPFKREWKLGLGTLETVSRGRGTWISVKLQSAPTCTYTHWRGLPGLLSRDIVHCIAPERLD